MTSFILGLLIGAVLGRTFDLWVDWKYPKPKPRKFEGYSHLVPAVIEDKVDESGVRKLTVQGGWLPQSGAFEIVVDGEHYLAVKSD